MSVGRPTEVPSLPGALLDPAPGRHAAVLDALPRWRYQRVWVPGGASGDLLDHLGPRAGHLHTEDPVQVADGPSGLDGCFDLVVLSDVLPHLSAADRADAATSAVRLLAPGGDVVLLHRRTWVPGGWVSGDVAAVEFGARPGLVRLEARVADDDRVDVLRAL